MKNKLYLSIILLIISILNLSLSLALDEKIRIDYCEFALSNQKVTSWEYQNLATGTNTKESDIFKIWDEATQEGIFIKSTNLNKTRGSTANYSITLSTTEHDWYNEYNNTRQAKTKIPIIQVSKTNPKWIYMRCYYIAGDYTILIADYGFSENYYITNDFNLTNDRLLIPSKTDYTKSPVISKSEILVSTSRSEAWLNTLNPQGDPKIISPYTKPYTILRSSNLSTMPSSFVEYNPNWNLREIPSPTILTSNPLPNLSIIYLNNSDVSVYDKLNVQFTQISKTIYDASISPQVYYAEDSGVSSLALTRGKTYLMMAKFTNPYSRQLNITFKYKIYADPYPTYRGILNRFTGQANYNEIHLTFEPKGTPGGKDTQNLYFNYTIPNDPDKKLVLARADIVRFNSNDPDKTTLTTSPYVASEYYPYLSFQTTDPRIELKKARRGDGTYFYYPIFKIIQELYVESFTNNLPVASGDYEVELRLYSDLAHNNLIWSNISLIEEILPKSLPTKKTFEIPIDLTWNYDRYYINFLSKMKKEIAPNPQFNDTYIANYYKDNAYFQPGDIAYQYDDILRFGPDSKIDSEKIAVFNPTLFTNKVRLNMTNITDENLLFSWDGLTFEKNPKPKEISLYPLQQKDITFWVKADYINWPTTPNSDGKMIINSYANLTSKTPTGAKEYITREANLTYRLFVEPINFLWFNLNPQGFVVNNPVGQDRQTLFFETAGSRKQEKIILSWAVQGSDAKLTEFKGKYYKVNLSILRNVSDTLIELKSKESIYEINGRKIETMEIDSNFSYDKYLLRIFLDKENLFSEIDSFNEPAEEENLQNYQIPAIITNCYFNSTDSYVYRTDYFNNKLIDKESYCECPTGLLLIFRQGYCADPYAGEICQNVANLAKCNNWEETRPAACAWKKIPVEGCDSCSTIPNTCGGYDNQETCESDPCQKSSTYDCSFLNCDETKEIKCIWENEKCKFSGTTKEKNPGEEETTQDCDYQIEILQSCQTPQAIKEIIKYTSTDPVNCVDKTRETLCGNEATTLPFFTNLNLIITSIIISLFYLKIKMKEGAKKPSNKN